MGLKVDPLRDQHIALLRTVFWDSIWKDKITQVQAKRQIE